MSASSPANFKLEPFSVIAQSVASGTTTKREPRGRNPLYGSTGQIGRTNRSEFMGPSILVARVGANAGSVYTVDGSYGVTDNTLVIRLKPDSNVSFISQLLKFIDLNRMVYGSGQPLVTSTIIKNLDIPAVTKKEQKRIAEVLDDTTACINATERLVAKKKAIFQGMMQQLLTGKTRLPGFDGHWQSLAVAVKSVMKARIGWQGLKTGEYRKSGVYRLVGGTEFSDGRIDWEKTPFVDKWRYDQDNYIKLHVGDILLTKDGTIGKTAYVDELPGPATLNSGVFVIRPLHNAYDPQFMYFMLRSRKFENFLNRLAAGSTINHLYQRDLVTLVLDVPADIKEQRSIAQVLADAENEIRALQARLDKARSIKAGIQQQLLTGNTRLHVEVRHD